MELTVRKVWADLNQGYAAEGPVWLAPEKGFGGGVTLKILPRHKRSVWLAL